MKGAKGMKGKLISTAQALIIFMGGLLLSAFISAGDHATYWNGTIFKVQTVDFNILSHMLPTKLSYALMRGDMNEIQHTVDSNFHRFGMVVTDATGKKILTWSGRDKNDPLTWKQALNPDELQKYPFDVLMDPPPLYSQWDYESPSAIERKASGLINQGNPIGRVYYVRGVPPEFIPDFTGWLGNPFNFSGAHTFYALRAAFVITLLFGVRAVYERIEQRRRVESDKLKSQLNTLKLQLNDRVDLIRAIESDQEFQRAKLTTEQRQDTERVRALEELLNQYDKELTQKQKDEGEQWKLLEQLQIDLKDAKDRLELTELELEERQSKLIDLQNVREEVENRAQEYAQQAKSQSQSLQNLRQRVQDLESTVGTAPDVKSIFLNQFERQVYNTLKDSQACKSGNWRLAVQFDTATNGISAFPDLIVYTRTFVSALEAKNYRGTIKPVGDSRNTEWHCNHDHSTVKIGSSHGSNPYQQVDTYAKNLMGRMNTLQPKPKIYGIVVFPQGAEVQNVSQGLTGFLRVVTLNRLVSTLDQIEKSTQVTGMPTIQRVEDALYGKLNNSKAA
jgi:Nuclease-related domain